MNKTKLCIITHSYPQFEGDWRSNFIESLARAYSRNSVDVTVRFLQVCAFCLVAHYWVWAFDEIGPND